MHAELAALRQSYKTARADEKRNLEPRGDELYHALFKLETQARIGGRVTVRDKPPRMKDLSGKDWHTKGGRSGLRCGEL